ncbi:hypothetical protein Q3G72_010785 [Acer saccharum]|nr:hypothetical protein Q3G72_010785 [Acer saccharum]
MIEITLMKISDEGQYVALSVQHGPIFSLVYLFSSSSILWARSSTSNLDDDEPLIRQVVSLDDGADDHDLLNVEHHFSVFKTKFGKTYATQEEHDFQFGVFKANHRRAKRHQMLDPSVVHGVTKFSDLTPSNIWIFE